MTNFILKPLNWIEPSASNNWIWMAESPWGTYGIHIDGGRHQAWLEAHEEPYERWLGDGYVGSLSEAMNQANKDYEEKCYSLFDILE